MPLPVWSIKHFNEHEGMCSLVLKFGDLLLIIFLKSEELLKCSQSQVCLYAWYSSYDTNLS